MQTVTDSAVRTALPSGVAHADDRIMREPEVYDATGLDRVTRWRMERGGSFPRRLKLSASAVGWLASEVNDWIAQRAAARDAA